MATPDQEEGIRDIAEKIDESLRLLYGEKMAFFLTVGRFNDTTGVSDFVSNTNRKDTTKFMKETAERLEGGNWVLAAGPNDSVQ